MKSKRGLIITCLLGAMLLDDGHRWAKGGSLQDVRHVVILMQENNSFDHYFGTLQGVRGFNDRNILLFPNGTSDLFQPTVGTNFVLPFPATNACLNSWLSDTWMTYYTRTNLPFYYALADAYTICDAYFASSVESTFPNRLYLFTGMIDPNGTAGGPISYNNLPASGFSWTTYPERLQAAGVSWKVYRPQNDWFGDALQWFNQYQNASPGNPLYDRGLATVNDVIAAFKADVTNGTLPQVSWIIPTDLGVSEHAPYSVEYGERFVQGALAALASNPEMFKSTVFILTYDEEGGYYDHVRSPAPPPGTADEFVHGSRIGLGTRVPMIIVSPWTRGGRVCSQVFDHTSIIRFLETWTGVQETNISAWRRQVCGDLTSTFDFTNPDTNGLPSLPLGYVGGCSGVTLAAPAVQILPVQEPGTRPACPLPYQPDANGHTDCNSNRLFISMTNAGTASVHFAVYANTYGANGPWQFDVPPGGSVDGSFVPATIASSKYDYACYGPNGFQRRFAGALNQDCNQIEVTTLINPADNSLTLGLSNSKTTTVSFNVTNHLNPDASWTFALPPASSTNCTISVLNTNQGWYDLTVTTDTDTNFLRHLAGHIENGSFSFTEPPAIVGNPLNVPTQPATNAYPPVVDPGSSNAITSINDLVGYLIARNMLANPDTNVLTLTVGSYGGSCALIYPGWASNYVVESSLDLDPAFWTQLDLASTVVSNCNVIFISETNAGRFFRLRQ